MGTGSGISGQLGLAKESGGWAVPTVSGMRFVEFNKESMKLNKKVIESVGIHAGGLSKRSARRAMTNWDAGGDIEIDLPTEGAGLLIQSCIGSWAATIAQIATSGAYLQVHQPGTHFGNSITMQKGAPDITGAVQSFTYNGCKCMDWELSAKVQSYATLKMTMDAQHERTPSSSPTPGLALATATYPAMNAGLFHFAEAQLLSGGTLAATSGVWNVTGNAAMANVKEVSVKQTNPMRNDRWFFNTAGLKSEQIENGFRVGSGSLTAEFASLTQYTQFAADTELVLQMLFVGPIIGTSGTNRATMEVLLTGVHLDGESPQVAGPDVIDLKQSFTWEQPSNGAPDIQIRITSTDTAI